MARQRSPSGSSIIKIAVTASAGAAIEWYDFFIYGTAAALVFPKLFFPADLPPFVAQIAAFSTFAVGFLARPIGGLLFGHFGDLFGRKRALAVALLIMGAATTCVGLLPTYATAGVWAPLLLVLLRFVQGLAVGGQWGGAALLAIESAPDGKQGFYGSFVQIGVPLGVVLANVVFLLAGLLLPADHFLDWGWRVPFLLSVALVLIGLYVQFVLEEPHAPKVETGQPKAPPLVRILKEHLGDVLLAGGAFVANNVCFYVAITYAVAYGATTVGVAKETMLSAVMIGSVVMVPVLIACGAASDRYGRRGIFMLGAVLCGLWAFAMFPLIDTGSPLLITAAISVALVLISLMYGPQAALFAELFPVEVRYSGASLGYQIGSVFGGGFAPIIATALFERFKSSGSIAIYMAAMCLVSLVSTWMLARRAAR
ncbi:MFS transporter [Caulobacter sp.]|uniref:MFS transporter n=1 Tax=Caulobacter sp. TaxID=78 RepID=UPI001B24A395|nr:MFS transporter [Caulobacter sp.]MBO9544529.1 MHS family MFS transporter [Caulobacter sp.]